MAGRFQNPLPQFMDATPTMYAGAKLFFYATGTSTKLNTYTTKALSVANSNPIVLDSAGRIPSDIFLQDLEYKVVLAPSTDTDPPTSPIWTADPVSHRDSSLVAKTVTGSGSPTGSVAGTAGSASILPDFYWDYTNLVLYVCTTTGTSSTAVWTAINSGASSPSVPPPQGRLTLTSSTPILAADVSAATAVYYTPHSGTLIPIYNGTTMTPTEFSELLLTLSSSHSASAIYDVFVFSNSGVLTLATGPAWTTATAGSGARGTGAGTTELTRVKGIQVNAVSMTGRNGSTTYTIGANLGTFVGSIFMDGTNGQITCHTSYGQSRKWGVWNAYNRVPIIMRAGAATASWNNNSGVFRASNNDITNRIDVFSGLAEEDVEFTFYQEMSAQPTHTVQNGIGVNSVTVASGVQGTISSSSTSTVTAMVTASHLLLPAIGVNRITCLENLGALGDTAYGNQANMMLLARWRG